MSQVFILSSSIVTNYGDEIDFLGLSQTLSVGGRLVHRLYSPSQLLLGHRLFNLIPQEDFPLEWAWWDKLCATDQKMDKV